jgi:hypothetical protein
MNEDICVICLGQLNTTDCIDLVCNHVYHLECLYNYFYYCISKKQASNNCCCPVCRQIHISSLKAITKSSILKIKKRIYQQQILVYQTKTQHLIQKWCFRIRSIVLNLPKQDILRNKQQEKICSIENTINYLRCQKKQNTKSPEIYSIVC